MTEETKKKFELDILYTIKTAQIQNGLRHGDYGRYRAYCTRRIQRIGKSLKFLHGRVYHRKEIEPHTVTNVRFLEYILMMSERSWAHAMLLKEDMENYRAKFHASRRLKKASKWAKRLVLVCHGVSDPRTILEAESYSAWFEGNILLDKGEWKGAREQLIRAKTVYEELGKVGNTDQQERCQERVSEIEPTIRYCNYSIEGQDKTSLVHLKSEAETQHGMDLLRTQLDVVLSELRKKEVESMNEVLWKGQKVPIRNESLRMSILSADSIFKLEMQQASTVEQKLQLYDKIFIHYSDALKTISSDVNNAKANKKPASELNSLEDLKDFVSYTKIEKTIQRNLMLIESLETNFEESAGSSVPSTASKADEVVRLYEILIENITELNNIRDANDEKANKVFAAKLLSFKALRCLYLGQTYAKVSKWAEASALFVRCQQQLKDALDHHKECEPMDTEMVEKLKKSLSKAQGLESLVHAQGFLDSLQKKVAQDSDSTPNSTQTADNTHSRGLLDNLNSYECGFLESGSIIDFPPSFEPMSCKPLLFDLALLGCSFPNLAERKKAPKTGIFARWWGSK